MAQKVQQGPFVKAGTAPVPPDHVLTPGGFRHKSLVHRVDRGRAVTREAGRLRTFDLSTNVARDLPPTEAVRSIPKLGSGWITYASWKNTTGNPISSFGSTWIVPPNPSTQSGQTIFIFNSLENTVQDNIVQPVLQWGVGAAGGGNYWAIGCWYVDSSGNAFYSPLVQVQEGDVLHGRMELTSRSGASCNYQAVFQGMLQTALPIVSISELTVATLTLECYQIGACSDYPNCPKTPITEIDLRIDGTPAPLIWTITDQVVDCGQNTLIVNSANPGGEVDIVY